MLLAGLRRAREASLGFVFVVQGDDGRAVNRTLAGSGLLAFFPVRGSLEEATDGRPGRHESARPGVLRVARRVGCDRASSSRRACRRAASTIATTTRDLQGEHEEAAEDDGEQDEEKQEDKHAACFPSGSPTET